MTRWLWLSVVVVVLDQATKWLVMGSLQPFEVVEWVPNLNLTLVFNSGAAFSFLAQAGGWQRWLFAAFALVISVVLTVWLSRLGRREWGTSVGLALIIGGAIGNLIDRVWLGAVIDFISVSLPFVPLDLFNPWPAFNIADSAISLGVVFLLIGTLLEREPPRAD